MVQHVYLAVRERTRISWAMVLAQTVGKVCTHWKELPLVQNVQRTRGLIRDLVHFRIVGASVDFGLTPMV
jgi:hypothetical protein